MKKIILRIIEGLAAKYIRKHKPKLVVVAGSVGKTGTKIAIATVLAEKYRVRVQQGNHNAPVSVPLAILGVDLPQKLRSPIAWLKVIFAAWRRILGRRDVDVIVQELGVDKPGDMVEFARYLHPDIAVVTAVSPEHMEFFGTLDAVAKEELLVSAMSGITIVSADDIAAEHTKYIVSKAVLTYGMDPGAQYQVRVNSGDLLDGKMATFVAPELGEVPVSVQLVGDHNVKTLAAAGAVGIKLGMDSSAIAVGMSKVKPIPGRMQVLRGLKESILIDDTYNASPLAVAAALHTLYGVEAPQRIAILGSMNELGALSAQAHKDVGQMCDMSKLDWVVTIGNEAAQFIAPAASAKGCQVRSFDNPYEAGGFAHSVLKPHAVVLAKGSQNGVFAEEALKVLLHDAEDDERRLVRQSAEWMKTKNAQFQEPISAENEA